MKNRNNLSVQKPCCRYTFVEYSSEWPVLFGQAAKLIGSILGEELVDVQHVGSTSVPGLASKPIIDVMPLVKDISCIDAYNEAMAQAGFNAWGEYGLPGRRYFTKDSAELRTHNVHTYQHDHPEALRHIAFCAYLREHDGAMREYGELKRSAFEKHPNDIEAYNDAKNDWIKRVEKVAIEWHKKNLQVAR